MKFISDEIEKCHYEYLRLVDLFYRAVSAEEESTSDSESAKLQKERESAKKALDEYADNVYSKIVYEVYSQLNPMLIMVSTGKKHQWKQIFKKPFEKLDSLDKSVLIGLVEQNGGYRFA